MRVLFAFSNEIGRGFMGKISRISVSSIEVDTRSWYWSKFSLTNLGGSLARYAA